MLSLQQLVYFVSVVDQGSITAASVEMQITQPGLSRQLRALEAQLGGPLLERLPRGMRLTPLGRAVLPRARSAVASARRVEQAARRVQDRSAGELHVATINSLSLGVLPSVLSSWHAEHPAVRVRVREYNHVTALLESFAEGHVDAAVTPLPPDWVGDRRSLGCEEFVVVVDRDHRLAGRDSARMEEFEADHWVQFDAEHGLHGVLNHHAALAGFTPRVAMQTTQTAAAAGFSASGLGPALVPANVLSPHFSGVQIALDPPIAREVFVIYRGPEDALTRAFVKTVLAEARLD